MSQFADLPQLMSETPGPHHVRLRTVFVAGSAREAARRIAAAERQGVYRGPRSPTVSRLWKWCVPHRRSAAPGRSTTPLYGQPARSSARSNAGIGRKTGPTALPAEREIAFRRASVHFRTEMENGAARVFPHESAAFSSRINEKSGVPRAGPRGVPRAVGDWAMGDWATRTGLGWAIPNPALI